MTTDAFKHLCDGLCDLMQEPRFDLPELIEGTIAFHLNVRDVAVSVLHYPQSCAGYAFVVFELGAVPDGDPRMPQILRELLNANFVLAHPHPPTLSCNPATGDVVLRCTRPLAEATPVGLFEMIGHGVNAASQWRRTFFLNDDPPQGGSADALAPGSFA
jgi:hypothetical protein